MPKLSRQKSDIFYSKFLNWLELLLNLKDALILVEGKRDLNVISALGIQERPDLRILTYSQKSVISIEELVQNEQNKHFTIVPLFDFDRQGQEYMLELQSYVKKDRIDIELRMELYSLTKGRLLEFEDLLYLLRNKLHDSYWFVLCEKLNINDYL